MTVKMKAPEGACSVVVEGVEYDVKKGFVEVEGEHHVVLLSHGFEVAVDEKPAKAKAAKAEQAEQAAEQSE